ncbi:hypothetical protein [Agromyces sp. NPDC058064]|uniref:hypothetical protein n=1 Tax=Agromyces sp. NPDC058064 TaxID=3346322 RepID=UPI0036DB428C
MPNHETNNVVITGTPEQIRQFVDEALIDYPLTEGEDAAEKPAKILDFARVVPEPEGIERGGCSGEHAEGVVCWYRWNPENWGTKWNAYSHSHYELRWLQPYDDDEPIYGRVDLRFETAWSQPTPVLETIQSRWGVTVHAVTQDEGGFPDVFFGDPIGAEVMHEVKVFEFDHWAREVEEPVAEAAAKGAER